MLDAQDGFEVVAACGDLDSLVEAVDREAPDVVVTDVRMPPGHLDEGVQAAKRLRETHPGVGVVVLSQYADPTYAVALLDTGSTGRAYVLKEHVDDLDQPLDRSSEWSRSGVVRDRPDRGRASGGCCTCATTSPLKQLTAREREVLQKMAEGMNNASIAEAPVLTERSVEKVINSIFMKLGSTWEPAVHKRVKAVILYLAEKLGSTQTSTVP